MASMRFPIGWKITSVVTLVFVLLALTSILFTRARFVAVLEKEFTGKALAIAQSLANSSEEKLLVGNVETVQSVMDGFKTVPGVAYVYVEGADGEVMAHTFRLRFAEEVRGRNPVKGTEKAGIATLRMGDAQVLEVAVPVLFGTAGTVHVGMDKGLIAAEISSVTRNLVLQFTLAFLVGVVMLHLATKLILLPLRRVLGVLRRTGEGDLSVRATVESNDEFQDLAREVNASTARLGGMISRIRQAAEAISSTNVRIGQVYQEVLQETRTQKGMAGSTLDSVARSKRTVEEVNEGVHVLEQSTNTSVSAVLELGSSIDEVSHQADTLFSSAADTARVISELSASVDDIHRNLTTLSRASEETASSMGQMGASVEQVRLHAESTAADAANMKGVAEQGVRASGEALRGMEAIRASSNAVQELVSVLTRRIEEIDAILRFINDITGKTNLLALNASIIASQAGEQGKGFGVVAGEINDLAQSTGAQTKKIAQVIEGILKEVRRTEKAIRESHQRVEEGVLLTRQTADALESIQAHTATVSDRVGEIARTTGEQAATGRRVMETAEGLSGSVGNIREAGGRQAAAGQRILEMARRVEGVAEKVRDSTREESETSRLINADLASITEAFRGISRAMEEQERSGEEVLRVTQEMAVSAESSQRSIEGLRDVIAVLDSRMALLEKELAGFQLGEAGPGPKEGAR